MKRAQITSLLAFTPVGLFQSEFGARRFRGPDPFPKEIPVEVPTKLPGPRVPKIKRIRIDPSPGTSTDLISDVSTSDTTAEVVDDARDPGAIAKARAAVFTGNKTVENMRRNLDGLPPKSTEEEEADKSGPPCDCDSQLDRAKHNCGKRSARVRKGGRSPDCGADPVAIGDFIGGDAAELARKVNRIRGGDLRLLDFNPKATVKLVAKLEDAVNELQRELDRDKAETNLAIDKDFVRKIKGLTETVKFLTRKAQEAGN